MSIQRRTVLTSGVAAGSLIALSACASDEAMPVAETTPPSATVDETQTPEETSGPILLGMTQDVPVGSGTKFPIDSTLTILVTQPREGVFRAFDATCTHAGCIVTGVQEDQIACGCHGARFDVDSGEPVAGPARSALGPIVLEVRGTELYASL
jgi:Rieske Fe-S protein